MNTKHNKKKWQQIPNLYLVIFFLLSFAMPFFTTNCNPFGWPVKFLYSPFFLLVTAPNWQFGFFAFRSVFEALWKLVCSLRYDRLSNLKKHIRFICYAQNLNGRLIQWKSNHVKTKLGSLLHKLVAHSVLTGLWFIPTNDFCFTWSIFSLLLVIWKSLWGIYLCYIATHFFPSHSISLARRLLSDIWLDIRKTRKLPTMPPKIHNFESNLSDTTLAPSVFHTRISVAHWAFWAIFVSLPFSQSKR